MIINNVLMNANIDVVKKNDQQKMMEFINKNIMEKINELLQISQKSKKRYDSNNYDSNNYDSDDYDSDRKSEKSDNVKENSEDIKKKKIIFTNWYYNTIEKKEKINKKIFIHFVNLNNKLFLWKFISAMKNNTSELLSDFSKYLNWSIVSEYGNITKHDIEKNKDKIKWNYLVKNKNISNEIIKEYLDKIDIFYLVNVRNIHKPNCVICDHIYNQNKKMGKSENNNNRVHNNKSNDINMFNNYGSNGSLNTNNIVHNYNSRNISMFNNYDSSI